MADEVTIDLVDGNQGRLTDAGWELIRIANVKNVSGVGSARLIIAAEAAGMPIIGDAHPSRNTAFLESIDPLSTATDIVKLKLTYKERFDTFQIQTSNDVIQDETNFDDGLGIGGDPENPRIIQVQYTYPDDYEYDENLRELKITQSALVSKFVPQRRLVFRLRELFSPEDLAAVHVGTVNESLWRGGNTRTWLCTGIDGTTSDGGIHWDNVYSFQYKRDLWQAVVIFIDPNTAKPPADLIDGPTDNVGVPLAVGDSGGPAQDGEFGRKAYAIYDETDFNSLPLT